MLKWISIHFKRAGISCEKPKTAFSEAAIGVFKISCCIHWKTPVRASFLIKETPTQLFPMNIAKFSKKPILIEGHL